MVSCSVFEVRIGRVLRLDFVRLSSDLEGTAHFHMKRELVPNVCIICFSRLNTVVWSIRMNMWQNVARDSGPACTLLGFLFRCTLIHVTCIMYLNTCLSNTNIERPKTCLSRNSGTASRTACAKRIGRVDEAIFSYFMRVGASHYFECGECGVMYTNTADTSSCTLTVICGKLLSSFPCAS